MQSSPLPTNRRFGALFVVVFSLVAAWAAWRSHALLLTIAIALATTTALLAWFRPTRLAPFNRAWMAFGLLLGRIISPIVLGAMFFLLITPVAMVTRAFGRDALRLKRGASSYWIERTPPGPESDSFRRQY